MLRFVFFIILGRMMRAMFFAQRVILGKTEHRLKLL